MLQSVHEHAHSPPEFADVWLNFVVLLFQSLDTLPQPIAIIRCVGLARPRTIGLSSEPSIQALDGDNDVLETLVSLVALLVDALPDPMKHAAPRHRRKASADHTINLTLY